MLAHLTHKNGKREKIGLDSFSFSLKLGVSVSAPQGQGGSYEETTICVVGLFVGYAGHGFL